MVRKIVLFHGNKNNKIHKSKICVNYVNVGAWPVSIGDKPHGMN